MVTILNKKKEKSVLDLGDILDLLEDWKFAMEEAEIELKEKIELFKERYENGR